MQMKIALANNMYQAKPMNTKGNIAEPTDRPLNQKLSSLKSQSQ